MGGVIELEASGEAKQLMEGHEMETKVNSEYDGADNDTLKRASLREEGLGAFARGPTRVRRRVSWVSRDVQAREK